MNAAPRTRITTATILIAFGCGGGGSESTAPPPPIAFRSVLTPDLSNVPAAQQIVIRAQLVDKDGHPFTSPGHTVTWSFTVLQGRGNGALSPETSTTNAEGIATTGFSGGFLAGVVYRITATDATLPEPSSTTTVTIVAGPVSRYTVGPMVSDPPAGAPVVISAFASDIYGNPTPIAGRVVTWALVDGPGGSFSQPTSPTDASGYASVSFTTTNTGGTSYTISATDAQGLTGSSQNFVTRPQVSIATISDGVGALSTCGLAPDGNAWCWGAINQAQLVNGGKDDRPLPGMVSSVETFKSISVGLNHTCGVVQYNFADCWGSNSKGEVGDGSTTPRGSSSPVGSYGDFSAISAGGVHSCGIRSYGEIWCWGSNLNGQLGASTQVSFVTEPSRVASTLPFMAVTAGGSHTCALTNTNDAYCWGLNTDGQLGDDSNTDKSTPVAVAGGLKFAALSAGESHTCGIAISGTTYCWGDSGALSKMPVAVSGGFSFAAISAGARHTCAIATDATAWCWGVNDSGELGDGTYTSSASPRQVGGGLQFSSIGAGGFTDPALATRHTVGHSCGVTTSNVVYCWGANDRGQLGTGPSPTHVNTPLKVLGQP
jgi:alpha-tubulin suppressor-like RCC1 family protein